MPVSIVTEKQPNAMILRLTGSIDNISSPDLTQFCSQKIQAGERTLILDLTNVRFLSSAGLSSLLITGKQLHGLGGTLLLCAPQIHVREVLRITGLDSVFPVRDTVEEVIS